MKLISFRRRHPSRQTRKKTRFHKYQKLFLIIIFVLIFAGISYFGISRILVIKNIDVKLGNTHCSNEDEIKNLINIKGKGFLFLEEKKYEKILKDKFVCIKKVDFAKKFPDRIIVSLEGREAVAVLKTIKDFEATNSGVFAKVLQEIASPSGAIASYSSQLRVDEESKKEFLIDNTGYVFAEVKDSNVPSLYFSNIQVKIGSVIEAEIVKNALFVFEKLRSFGIEVSSAKVYNPNILLVDAKPYIIFNLENKINNQVGSLQLILEKAKINEEKIEFIDLRFDKPVIRYSPKKGKT